LPANDDKGNTMRLKHLFSGLLLAGWACISPLHAAVAYDEAVSGDLSGSGLAPTFVALAAGSNEVRGITGNPGSNPPGSGVDRDYFGITVPSGYELSHLTLLPGTSVFGTSTFFGVQSGTAVTVAPTAPSASGLLGAMHYSTALVGTNILPVLGTPFAGSSGFAPPLTAGNYAFWVQELGPAATPYVFDLMITPVPEPQTWAMLLAGLGIAGVAARSRNLNRS
jgi:PEP-CTERM motif